MRATLALGAAPIQELLPYELHEVDLAAVEGAVEGAVAEAGGDSGRSSDDD
jgi:hypothetical protein